MALITISGYPCVGKSRRATQLKDHLEQRLSDPLYTGPSLSVTLLSDDTLNIPRAAYDGEPYPYPILHTPCRWNTPPGHTTRQPIRKASTRGTVHRPPTSPRQRPYRPRRRAQLHQGVPVSNVLRCKRSQGPCMYGAWSDPPPPSSVLHDGLAFLTGREVGVCHRTA